MTTPRAQILSTIQKQRRNEENPDPVLRIPTVELPKVNQPCTTQTAKQGGKLRKRKKKVEVHYNVQNAKKVHTAYWPVMVQAYLDLRT
jgi:hypothetical protein